jgi:hypothetical protein
MAIGVHCERGGMGLLRQLSVRALEWSVQWGDGAVAVGGNAQMREEEAVAGYETAALSSEVCHSAPHIFLHSDPLPATEQAATSLSRDL